MDSDTIQLAITAIATERQALNQRLEYLNRKDAELRQAGVLGTGTVSKATTKRAAKGQSKAKTATPGKRVISEETRQKMSISQQKRHREKELAKAAATQSPEPVTATENIPPAYHPATANA